MVNAPAGTPTRSTLGTVTPAPKDCFPCENAANGAPRVTATADIPIMAPARTPQT